MLWLRSFVSSFWFQKAKWPRATGARSKSALGRTNRANKAYLTGAGAFAGAERPSLEAIKPTAWGMMGRIHPTERRALPPESSTHRLRPNPSGKSSHCRPLGTTLNLLLQGFKDGCGDSAFEKTPQEILTRVKIWWRLRSMIRQNCLPDFWISQTSKIPSDFKGHLCCCPRLLLF